jgi:hypothetical protein
MARRRARGLPEPLDCNYGAEFAFGVNMGHTEGVTQNRYFTTVVVSRLMLRVSVDASDNQNHCSNALRELVMFNNL